MKTFLPFLTVVSLALGTLTFVGCESNNQSRGDQGATAGGNGAFGESPARPGSYQGDQYNNPTSQPAYNR